MTQHKIIAILAAGLLAAPVIAQTAAPAPAATDTVRQEAGKERVRKDRGPRMSEDGRKIMGETMRAKRQDVDREKLRAVREKIATIVGAPKLDVGALRAAMRDERQLVDLRHANHQERMIAALQKLSPEDRKIFAERANHQRKNIDRRMHHKRTMQPAAGPAQTPVN